MSNMLEIAISYGVFASLFLWLLHVTNKRNEEREKEYCKVISKNQEVISEQAKAFTHLSKDVSEIKSIVIKIKDKR